MNTETVAMGVAALATLVGWAYSAGVLSGRVEAMTRELTELKGLLYQVLKLKQG